MAAWKPRPAKVKRYKCDGCQGSGLVWVRKWGRLQQVAHKPCDGMGEIILTEDDDD